jgi:hypothetical protein
METIVAIKSSEGIKQQNEQDYLRIGIEFIAQTSDEK